VSGPLLPKGQKPPLDWKIRARRNAAYRLGKSRRRGRIDLVEAVWSIVNRLVPEEALRLERLRGNWHEIATPRVAERTWPALIRQSKLFIDVSDNQWMHELHYGKQSLLARIQTICPQARISELKLALGPVPSLRHRPGINLDPPQATPPQPPPLSPNPPEETMQALMQISDPELRQIMANSRLALGKWRTST
jgi:hypothetical protein